MEIIKGGKIAKKILSKLKSEVANLPFAPVLCDVLIGDDAVALSYVKIKAKRAEETGLKFELVQLPVGVSTADVLSKIKSIQTNPHLAGVIVQLPLPINLDRKQILNSIDPRLDVDCLGDANAESFYAGKSAMLPPTAAAVIEILEELNLDLKSKEILVVGQGDLVGRPVTFLLKQKGYNKIKTADGSTNLETLLPQADVVISGAGQPRLIKGDWIKQGVILIDCGTSESAGSIVGDIDSQSVAGKASFLAPVPGGVGPITVAKLLENVVNNSKGENVKIKSAI
jgi:methylenetetrahydrofolate dehydrogenase (NADP+)/methenyltetrahydrofolate cyclohydrolase